MDYEVIVVGAGIGGLTVAALLAARGANVCLFERQSHVGGCVANFEYSGYTFEPTFGLYSGWEPGGIHEKIFSALPVKPPGVDHLSPSYVVRLPDGKEVAVSSNAEQFEDDLRLSFPECSDAAVAFYRNLSQVAQAADGTPESDKYERSHDITAFHLADCSSRFRRFIDVQLQTFAQCVTDQCSYARAASALTAPLHGMWSIRGGAQALADSLAESLKKSGGALRLNSPVLRLAYASDGTPTGVDLLSGQRVTASHAIVSNLTIWDTYGKLIGLSRTPRTVSAQLKQLRGWGAYLLFMSMHKAAATRLRSSRILALSDWQLDRPYNPEEAQFSFSAATQDDSRAPQGQVAVTVSTYTNAEDWFGFHQDETAHEEQDQSALESVWSRLHAAMPELGDSVEIIETATPLTFYENTRRKLGMVGGLCASPETEAQSSATVFPNVFLVSDTASGGMGIAGVARSAKAVAELVAPLNSSSIK